MSARFRLVLFGSGSPMSIAALDALSARWAVSAVVIPARRRWYSRDVRTPLIDAAGCRSIPVVTYGSRKFSEELERVQADLFCIASFPKILSRKILSIPRVGTLNVHPSLLPRHRGGDPLFWTYFCDDRETGVTVHWVDGSVDGGDIVWQIRIPVPRATRVEALYAEMCRHGAAALMTAIEQIESGVARRIKQDESLASYDPLPVPSTFHLDPSTWCAERVWHVLNGLGHRRNDLLRDEEGAVLLHGAPLRWGSGTDVVAGTIERVRAGLRVHCTDGWVEVTSPSAKVRLRHWLRSLISTQRRRRSATGLT